MAINTVRAPQVWDKTTYDPNGEFMADAWTSARDIGYVRNNYSRISIISALTVADSDKTDWYKFQVQSKGTLQLSVRSDAADDVELDPSSPTYLDDVIEALSGKGLRVEIMRQEGKKQVVWATNDKSNAKAYATFMSLLKGEEKVTQTGNFYLKISTEDGEVPKEDVNYILQFQMGDSFKHDYATVEKVKEMTESERAQARLEAGYSPYSDEVRGLLEGASTSAAVLAAESASTMLQAGAANMSSILSINAAASKTGMPKIFNFTA